MQSLERFGIRIGKDDYRQASIYGVACIYALMEKQIAEYLRSYNLTPAKFNALMIIKHNCKNEGLSQIEIGRSLIVSASNMTRLLDRLQNEGLIERFSRQGDRRIKLIKISQKGSDLLDKAWPGYYEKISHIANLLDKGDQKDITCLINKWCQRLGGGKYA